MKAVLILMVLIVIVLGTRQTALSRDTKSVGEKQVKFIICKTFGSHCGEALRVSWCESRWKTWAHNGQYLGLFQMGRWERATYGHGSGAWIQAQSAYRYFIASGSDWSPWECKP